jgi:non-ribosomal peptide synthetase component F
MFVGHPQTARQSREPFAYQEEDLEQSIASRFQAIVGSNPDAFAYLDGEHSLTYAALNGRANWVAYELLKFSVNSNEPAMVMAEDPVDHLIAQLGILKAGRICVPSDVSYPDARLRQILEDSRTDVL